QVPDWHVDLYGAFPVRKDGKQLDDRAVDRVHFPLPKQWNCYDPVRSAFTKLFIVYCRDVLVGEAVPAGTPLVPAAVTQRLAAETVTVCRDGIRRYGLTPTGGPISPAAVAVP